MEDFFFPAGLKAYIKRFWSAFEGDPGQGFHAFLRRCIHDVGGRLESAEGHFRHAGIVVEKT